MVDGTVRAGFALWAAQTAENPKTSTEKAEHPKKRAAADEVILAPHKCAV